MKRLILGAFLICLVIFINMEKDNIYYYYQVYKLKDKYHESLNNDYSNKYEFNYVSENNDMELKNKEDIKNSIYSLLNNGNDKIKRYCSNTYHKCNEDIKDIANDADLLSYINSFVHPYNSFSNIVFNYDGDLELEVTNNKTYSDEEIKIINEKVDNIISNIITEDMSVEDKVKKIHDYIIENTKYDSLKTKNIKDTTYKSNTSYGVLFQGYGICSGYADTLSIFLYKLGIPNYKISNDSHIWNLVLIDNVWYHIDLTWDDPIYSNIDLDLIEYDYFLITTNELIKLNDNEHSFDFNIYIEAR